MKIVQQNLGQGQVRGQSPYIPRSQYQCQMQPLFGKTWKVLGSNSMIGNSVWRSLFLSTCKRDNRKTLADFIRAVLWLIDSDARRIDFHVLSFTLNKNVKPSERLHTHSTWAAVSLRKNLLQSGIKIRIRIRSRSKFKQTLTPGGLALAPPSDGKL